MTNIYCQCKNWINVLASQKSDVIFKRDFFGVDFFSEIFQKYLDSFTVQAALLVVIHANFTCKE